MGQAAGDQAMRIVLIHWKPAEATEYIEALGAAGFETEVLAPNGSAGLVGTTEFANAIIIDLSRLPLQGRDVAIALRKRAATRRVPIVFAGGAQAKVDQIRKVLPDAAYLEWDQVPAELKGVIRRASKTPVVPEMMAGYSGTPLPKKLGIKEGTLAALLGAPGDFDTKLEPLPAGARLVTKAAGAGRVVLFISAMRDLDRRWQPTIDAVAEGATVWIAWPKKASGVATDVTENAIRAYGLERGWVDYKICAIDETWSGLAFSKRKPVRKS